MLLEHTNYFELSDTEISFISILVELEKKKTKKKNKCKTLFLRNYKNVCGIEVSIKFGFGQKRSQTMIKSTIKCNWARNATIIKPLKYLMSYC